MNLLVTQEDFATLSDATKQELAALLGLSLSSSLGTSVPATEDDMQDDAAEDLTSKAIKRFMSGVSGKTKKVLQVFAESNGETTVHEIENLFDDDFHWPGFMSGVTRRLRKMTGDTSANFFQWDDSSDDWKDCKVSVSPMTFESLKNYFSI